MLREALLAHTFVELADSLVEDFDVVDILTLLVRRCEELLGVDATGLMLVSAEGDLRLIASSSEAMRTVELFELQAREGPCPDAYRTGEPALHPDLSIAGTLWPNFGPVAIEAGFNSVYALPMRLRGVTIGALNMFRTETGPLEDGDIVAARALADVATIAILQNRAVAQANVVADQLGHALQSRVLIEQAKGILAERGNLDMEGAFSRLRSAARNGNRRLVDVARSVIEGNLVPESPPVASGAGVTAAAGAPVKREVRSV